MTIALGLMARDGMVIAADSQMTSADGAMFDHGKIRPAFTSDAVIDPDTGFATGTKNRGVCVVAGAGVPDAYIFNAFELIHQTFKEEKQRDKLELKSAFEQTLADFHEAHILPYLSLPATERPSVELLIACSRHDDSYMWRSAYSALTEVHFYDPIGHGATQARPILATMYRFPSLDLAETAVLASFVLHSVKNTNAYVGLSTDIVCIRGVGFLPIWRQRTEELDLVWRRYARTVGAATLRRVIGSPLPEEDKHMAEILDAAGVVVDQIRADLAAVFSPAPDEPS